jgi:hypothetical protein
MQPQNEIGRPNVTPERPIMNRNSAVQITSLVRFYKAFVGAFHMDGAHAYTPSPTH